MTKSQAQILEAISSLPLDEQRELAQQLSARLLAGSFYERMSTEQRAELNEGVAQAGRGEGSPEEDVFARLGKRFGVSFS